MIQFREAAALGLNNPTPEDRRAWLEILQTKVTVKGGAAVVACRLSGEAEGFDLSTGYNISRDWETN